MPRVIHTTVYTYDELTDKAKERARDWFRTACADDNDFADHLTEQGGDFETVAKFCGWTISEARHSRKTLAIYWTGFWNQGDGACFEGTWSASDVDAPGLKAYAPTDTALHTIVDELASLARALPSGIGTSKHSGHYSHEHCATIDLDIEGDPDPAISDEIAVAMGKRLASQTRALMRWMYAALSASYNDWNSDERIAESIIANEYEFLESGKRA